METPASAWAAPGGPVVSIVVPSLNHGEFIGHALESLLGQRGDFWLDAIVVDGGSRDGTTAVLRRCEELLEEESRVVERDGIAFRSPGPGGHALIGCRGVSLRWRSEPDGGPVEALRKGFAAAGGGVFGWLNADDFYLDPGALQRVCGHFAADPALQLLFGDGRLVSAAGAAIGEHRVAEVCLPELLYLDYHLLQPASFLRRSAYRADLLDDRYGCAFDAFFFISLLRAGVPYRKVADPLAAFRLHPGARTVARIAQRHREALAIARRLGAPRRLLAVSAAYRAAERWLHPRVQVKRGPRFALWVAVRRLAYRLLLGRRRR